jgi:protein-S-isoprenylcysteine O-methyltransferase Ste14
VCDRKALRWGTPKYDGPLPRLYCPERKYVMADRIATFIAKHGGRRRPVIIQVLSLAVGAVTFLGIVPYLLGRIGHRIAGCVALHIPRILELGLGLVAIASGLFFLVWSVAAFWFAGKGTPVPLASPTRLVTTGPFRYTRNPIKLGAVLLYFGAGTVADQLITGLVMAVVALLLGTAYHKAVEEKELLIRFGEEYRVYRESTSFFIPRPPKRR